MYVQEEKFWFKLLQQLEQRSFHIRIKQIWILKMLLIWLIGKIWKLK